MALLSNYFTGDNEPANEYDDVEFEPTQAEVDAEELAGLDDLAPEPAEDVDDERAYYCHLCAENHVNGSDVDRECSRYREMSYGNAAVGVSEAR